MQPSWLWLAAAGLLTVGELLVGEFFLLMTAAGALGGAGAAAAGAPVWGQVLVFCAVTLLMLGVVRPLARRRMLSALPEHRTGVEALPGRRAEVVERIDAGPEAGLVAISGDRWSARPAFEGEVFEPGDAVVVDRVDGATLVVMRLP